MKRAFFAVMLALCVISGLCLAGCSGSSSGNTVTTGEVGVAEDPNFGGVLIEMSQQDFLDCGFEYGDSVDVSLSNGKTYEDVPFYNGYYAATGELLICSYPGEDHPIFKRAQQTFWDECGADESTKITITLREHGKYLDVQEALSMEYSNDREDFDSDEAFANFRSINVGNLKKNILYRSASPIDHTYSRAVTACELAQDAGIKFILDLSDSEENFDDDADNGDSDCQFVIDLKKAGNVGLLNLTSSFTDSAFKQDLAAGLYEMCQHDGPYLIHCVEGKDRTGFVCMLLEALAGATVDEITDDYMITYDNYYGINKTTDTDKYYAVLDVKCNDLLKIVAGVDDFDDVSNEALQSGAEKYLKESGLSAKQIAKIKKTICK